MELIKNRRTIRKYKDKPIPKEILEKIIDAGRWGASPHNSQPWFFIVIEDISLRNALIYNINKTSRNYLTSTNILFKKSIRILETAPVIILVYNNHYLSKKVFELEESISSLAYISEIEGISSTIQNMQLVAFSLNLGMAWLTMPLISKEQINNLIATKDELVAILTLGYPAEKGQRLKRKPLSETVRYIK
ncbi:MAG: nitroreductase family protein [bacterium]